MSLVIDFADQYTVVSIDRKMFGHVVGRMHDPDIHVGCPIAVGRSWNRVPVVARLVVNQHGFLARCIDNVGQRQRNERCPRHEMRICYERIASIIQKSDFRLARKYHGVASPGLFEGVVMTRLQRLNMCRIKRGEIRISVGIVCAHRVA